MSQESTPPIRPATTADFTEILRLARSLWTDMGFSKHDEDAPWIHAARQFFSDGYADGRLRAYVAADPDNPQHLISCGIGVIMRQMPASWLPNGQMGYLQWFSTEEPWRKRGLATNILHALKAWFEGSAYPNLWYREIR